MPSVADLVEPDVVRRMVEPAAFARGEADADGGLVTLTTFGPLAVTAEVRASEADTPEAEAVDTVTLRSTRRGLEWSCTCAEGRAGVFCRHAVAVALETWRKAPKRRR